MGAEVSPAQRENRERREGVGHEPGDGLGEEGEAAVGVRDQGGEKPRGNALGHGQAVVAAVLGLGVAEDRAVERPEAREREVEMEVGGEEERGGEDEEALRADADVHEGEGQSLVVAEELDVAEAREGEPGVEAAEDDRDPGGAGEAGQRLGLGQEGVERRPDHGSG
ncbi:MAG: hypothetical protein R6V44_17330 [Paracoccaceae bacterium]